MKQHKELLALFEMPFRFYVDVFPLLSGGGDAILRVKTSDSLTGRALMAIKSSVTPFEVLSKTGAMSGDKISPAKSRIRDISPPMVSGDEITWKLSGCLIDDRAALLLANLLISVTDKHPIKTVEISNMDNMDNKEPPPLVISHPTAEEPYPPVFPSVPFSLQMDDRRSGDTIGIAVDFESAPDEKTVGQIEGDLLSWAGVTSIGAYLTTPKSGAIMHLVPDLPLTFIDESLEMTLDKFRAHLGAIDGLINVCIQIHENVARVSRVAVK